MLSGRRISVLWAVIALIVSALVASRYSPTTLLFSSSASTARKSEKKRHELQLPLHAGHESIHVSTNGYLEGCFVVHDNRDKTKCRIFRVLQNGEALLEDKETGEKVWSTRIAGLPGRKQSAGEILWRIAVTQNGRMFTIECKEGDGNGQINKAGEEARKQRRRRWVRGKTPRRWRRVWRSSRFTGIPNDLFGWPVARSSSSYGNTTSSMTDNDWRGLSNGDELSLLRAAALLARPGRTVTEVREASVAFRGVEARLKRELLHMSLEMNGYGSGARRESVAKSMFESYAALRQMHLRCQLALADAISSEMRIRTHSNTSK